MEDLDRLLDSYKTYSPSKRCYLDARYFNAVLDGYAGLVNEPIVIHITEDEAYKDAKGEWRQKFFVQEMSKPLRVNLSDDNPDLIRVVVELEHIAEGKATQVSRHSNLLIVTSRPNKNGQKVVYRFEPMK